jgi:hypothetical protein
LTDLFNTPPQTPEVDPNKKYYEELVGEDKKFKTNEDLAKAKAESDRFIQQLQGELAGIRQELSTRQTLEELMTKVGSQRVPENTPGNNQNPNGDDDGKNVKALSEEDIARLVEDRLTKAERARVQNSNLETVKQTLMESFGSDYVTHLKAKAAELGVSEEYLNSMAKETPKAFLKLVEADGEGSARRSEAAAKRATPVAGGLFTPPSGANIQSTNQSKGFSPTGTPKMSFYENIKRTDPAKYWSAAIQNKMHKDAIALGEAFFDTP